MAGVTDMHPFVRQVIVDKIRGAVIGSAIGDAVGLYAEFFSKAQAKRVYPDGTFRLTGAITPFYKDAHRSKFVEGEWTDDTDHALLIILSFLHSDGKDISPQDLAKRLQIWVEHGLLCLDRPALDIGITIGSIVRRSTYLNNPQAAAYRSWARSGFFAAANGSLMRTYPLGLICMNKTLEETFAIATDFSVITHPDPKCVVSCCIVTALLRGILRAEVQAEAHIDTLIEQAAAFVESSSYLQNLQAEAIAHNPADNDPLSKPPPPLNRYELRKHTTAQTFADLELSDLPKQGYVYKCLGSSILCLRLAMRWTLTTSEQPTSVFSAHRIFENLITELTLEGGDADTNAVVAGALLGCWLGFSLLPPHWYNGLSRREWLMDKIEALTQVLGVVGHVTDYVGSGDPDTRLDGGKGFSSQRQDHPSDHELLFVM